MNREIRCQKVYEYIQRRTNEEFDFKDIYRYILGTNELDSESKKVATKRMFYRDLDFMREELGIDIQRNENKGGYYIADEKSNQISERLFETYHLLEMLKQKDEYAPFVIFEKRKVRGTYLFNEFLKAIKTRDLTQFNYYNYLRQKDETIQFYPYHLKEAKNRWYAVGIKKAGDEILALGLDRINSFEIIQRNKRSKFIDGYDIDTYYHDCLGAYNKQSISVEKIVLEFSKFQGEYIKAYPIHDSQKAPDAEGKTIIELEMKITPDLLMELMQYGHKIKILAPKKLLTYMIKMHENAIKILKSESNSHLVEEEFLLKK